MTPALSLQGTTFPVHDWQFWVTTGIALAAAIYLASKLLPVPWLSARRKKKRMRTKATLTIGGKAVR